MTVNQKDFQSQVTAGLGTSDDNAVLSLSPEDFGTGIKDDPTPVLDTETTGDETISEVTDDQTVEQLSATYTKDQVQAIIRTRVANYEKKLERAKASDAALDRIAEVSGLNRDQLISRLANMSDAEQAKILGVSPEQVAVIRANRTAQQASERQIRELNRDLEMTKLKADKKYSDIDLFMDEVLAKVEDHPSLTLKDAYTLVKGELGLTATVRDAEQRVLNSQAAARGKGMVNPVGAAQTKPLRMSEQTVQAAKRVDMDPNVYEAFKQIDNIDAYRAYKKSQKGGK